MEKISNNLERMRKNNPMFRKEVVEKRLKTIREKYPNWGSFNVGNKRPDLAEYNRMNPRKGENHGMFGKKQKQLTKEKISDSRIEGIREGRIVHPRGMLGKSNKWGHHTEETKLIIREERKKQVLPIKDTSIEVKIQNFLKQLGIEYFTHQYMKIEHGYQCDIMIPIMNLVIECDGDYWHSYPTGKEIDHIRTKELITNGFKVLRLWECEIKGMKLKDFKNKLNAMEVQNGKRL